MYLFHYVFVLYIYFSIYLLFIFNLFTLFIYLLKCYLFYFVSLKLINFYFIWFGYVRYTDSLWAEQFGNRIPVGRDLHVFRLAL